MFNLAWLSTNELISQSQTIAYQFMTKLNTIITTVKNHDLMLRALSTTSGVTITHTTNSISISSFTRNFLDGSSTTYPAVTFSNLTVGTLYYIYQIPKGQIKLSVTPIITNMEQYLLGNVQL